MWNVYCETLNGNSRTNNSCEGFQNLLQFLLGSNHPRLWAFIECSRKAERKHFHALEQLQAGSQVLQPKKV